MPGMTSKEAVARIAAYIEATDADGTPWIKALRLAVGALLRPRYCGECVKYCRADKCPTPGDASAWKTACGQFKGSNHE